jgi:hypothetical protein
VHKHNAVEFSACDLASMMMLLVDSQMEDVGRFIAQCIRSLSEVHRRRRRRRHGRKREF